jgi:hypothetical protein
MDIKSSTAKDQDETHSEQSSEFQGNLLMQKEMLDCLISLGESGPQSSELAIEDIEQILKNGMTIYSKIDGTKLPVLYPIEAIQSFRNAEYYKDRDISNTYYIPIYGGLTEQQVRQIACDIARQVAAGTSLVTYHQDGNEYAETYAAQILAKIGNLEHQPIIDSKNDTESKIIHFEGFAQLKDRTNINEGAHTLSEVYRQEVAKDRYNQDPHTGVTLLDTTSLQENNELLEKLWTMSNYQFTHVVENLPIRQSPTKEEFFSIITHKDTSNIVYFDDGEPVCLMTFMHSVESADWLRKDFFDQRYGTDTFLSYFAFIVADAEKAPSNSAFKVIQLCSELLSAAQRDMFVVFECTNISAEYIPKIVEQVVEAMGTLTVHIDASASYTFRHYLVG